LPYAINIHYDIIDDVIFEKKNIDAETKVNKKT